MKSWKKNKKETLPLKFDDIHHFNFHGIAVVSGSYLTKHLETMKPINNLYDLFVEILLDRYDAEVQQTEALPLMIQKAASTKLKHVLRISLEHSRKHLEQLNDIFASLHLDPLAELSESALGIFHETWQLIDRCTTQEITDATIVTAVQMIHHNDIAGYGTLSSFAKSLELDEISHIFHDILIEEKDNDELLSEVAETSINLRALPPLADLQ